MVPLGSAPSGGQSTSIDGSQSGDIGSGAGNVVNASATGQQINVNQANNNAVHIIPARSAAEDAAIIEVLLNNPQVLRLILLNDLESSPAIMFRYTHGDHGPPHLKNVTVNGKYVTEKREDGDVRMPLRQYVAYKVVRSLSLLDSCLPRADFYENQPVVQERIQTFRDALQRPLLRTREKERLSMLGLATLYRDDNTAFHKVVKPDDRKGVHCMVKTLVAELTDLVI